MASAANSQPRLHTQNLAAEVSARRSAISLGLSLSNARARRRLSAQAASDSSAISASTLRIKGCSISSDPNALR